MQKVLLLSLLLGFFTASPVGPAGMLCLRRTLACGAATGLTSALGIACAYAFWSYAATHGLAAVAHWIDQEKAVLNTGIGLFFLLYGLHGVFNAPSTRYHRIRYKGRLAEFITTFLVVFLNPVTFVMFSALFALFGIAQSHFGFAESVEVAFAVFIGSMIFWIVISHIIETNKARVHHDFYRTVSRASSIAIVLFGSGILLYRVLGPLFTAE